MTYNKYKINTMSSVHIDEFYAVSYKEAESFAIKFCDLYGIKAFHLAEVPQSFDINGEPADDDTDKQEAELHEQNLQEEEYPAVSNEENDEDNDVEDTALETSMECVNCKVVNCTLIPGSVQCNETKERSRKRLNKRESADAEA